MKNAIKRGFERAARDADIVELAEWGMNDYSHLISTDSKIIPFQIRAIAKDRLTKRIGR